MGRKTSADQDDATQSTTLSIGDLAERTGVRPEAIRYYEREGVIPPATRTGQAAIASTALRMPSGCASSVARVTWGSAWKKCVSFWRWRQAIGIAPAATSIRLRTLTWHRSMSSWHSSVRGDASSIASSLPATATLRLPIAVW